MTGLNGHRVYLDWNASAPLRPEARAAMLAAMDAVGNPSSVHAEGRAAKAIIEKARGQVAALVGCEPSEVVFTSGATEANAMAILCCSEGLAFVSSNEHDSVYKIVEHFHFALDGNLDPEQWNLWIPISKSGLVNVGNLSREIANILERSAAVFVTKSRAFLSMGVACSETGIVNPVGAAFGIKNEHRSITAHSDATQGLGKIDIGPSVVLADQICGSGHKIGAAKGVGFIALRHSLEREPLIMGGGQEMGRRSGTENVVGIAGFGAAAEAARRDLEAGVWDRVVRLRDVLEDRLAAEAPDLIVFGKDAPRLPNTSCFAVPHWRGETQVMQMDLAGFAVSAGSACSSGKVNKASRVLLAMGFDEVTASSAIRVSMGPTTTEAEVMAFADAWIDHYRRRKNRAA